MKVFKIFVRNLRHKALNDLRVKSDINAVINME